MNLHAQAKIPTPAPWTFSECIWELNLNFHRRSGLRVCDAWNASRELLLADGWTSRTLLSTVCRHHLQAMRTPERSGSELHRLPA